MLLPKLMRDREVFCALGPPKRLELVNTGPKIPPQVAPRFVASCFAQSSDRANRINPDISEEYKQALLGKKAFHIDMLATPVAGDLGLRKRVEALVIKQLGYLDSCGRLPHHACGVIVEKIRQGEPLSHMSVSILQREGYNYLLDANALNSRIKRPKTLSGEWKSTAIDMSIKLR